MTQLAKFSSAPTKAYIPRSSSAALLSRRRRRRRLPMHAEMEKGWVNACMHVRKEGEALVAGSNRINSKITEFPKTVKFDVTKHPPACPRLKVESRYLVGKMKYA